MRIVVVQSSAHAGELLRAPHRAGSLPSSVVEALGGRHLPDGLLVIVDHDGSLAKPALTVKELLGHASL